MSFQAQAWARGVKTGSASRKAVLLAVANYDNDKYGCSWLTQEEIAEQTELSRHSVMRALADLEKMGVLAREHRNSETGHRLSDRIVLNFEYQSSTMLRSTEQRSTELPSTSHGATAIKKPLSNPLKDSSRGTRLPKDWQPSQASLQWAMTKFSLDLDQLREITAEFHDFWHAVPGKSALKLDWDGTWRNRVRNSAWKYKRKATNGPHRTTGPKSMAETFANLYAKGEELERQAGDGGNIVKLVPRLLEGS